jgi:hypothetical protein
MSDIEALDKALYEAQAAGLHVRLDGRDLTLEALGPTSPERLGLLEHHKATILALLQQKKKRLERLGLGRLLQ